ncbi:glutamine amidotransferase, class I [Legionella wadsworthii]|uniref:Glutamine amidotransferase, class I n=1 Tax=Legionella wadsworthii TaxID=28088 RepID=A0A378LPU1_9GAMM|nr:glutamine amidotransferase [Legionella wadsworthii]STY28985.1 glutamine amidotransferase, class I [Legionella wadsworthii]
MKIGVLLCDEVDDELIRTHGKYQDMYVKLLQQVDPDLQFLVYEVRSGEFPAYMDAADAYVITGSRYGVNDDLPWIAALEKWVRDIHTHEKKMIGICFGHQLIAKALGGNVSKSPKGWGLGISVNKMSQQKPWMRPHLKNLNLIVSHQDQVVDLPEYAEVLASSDFCPFYMLQIKDNLFTVQGHPEYTKGYSQALMELRKNKLGEATVEKGLKSLQQHCDGAVFARWIVNFLNF